MSEKAVYWLENNGAIIKEGSSEVTKFPLLKFQNSFVRVELLERFLQIRTSKDLLKYCKKYGVPHRSKHQYLLQINALPKEIQEQKLNVLGWYTDPTLDFANLIRWLKELHQVISDQDHEKLKLWFPDKRHLVHKLDLQSLEVEVSVVEEVLLGVKLPLLLKRMSASKMLPESEFNISISISKWESEALRKKYRLDFAKAYLAHHLTWLMKDIRLNIDKKWQPSYIIDDHLAAVSLALFDEVTAASLIGICRNPHCPTKFYSRLKKVQNKKREADKEKEGTKKTIKRRKHRSDRYYCSRAKCQKWGRENLGPVRSSKEQSDAAEKSTKKKQPEKR
ncbi:MAG: hypothetical protein K2W82_09805 [Candidatus Obscuribacterales bacterium]|nr:hypothetical protein [Candidatus Obscuribacterales bacterium]